VGNGTTTTLLPNPDFTCTPTDCKFVAGIRPYRQTTFRLEPQTVGTKFIVHNYGHGGAGITMCWGCAVEVREMVRQHTGGTPRPVAVLGAGVMGLTAAALLVEAGYSVGVYASSLLSTTSDIAGGQWQPSFVEREPTAAAKHRFENILRTSFAMHRDRIGQGYGVSKRINYSKHGSGTSFDKVPHDVIPPPTPYAHLPFAHLNVPGFGYHTLLVEPPIFLKKMRDNLSAAGVPFTQKEFHSPSDVAQLGEPVVVNCTGMGSKEIFGDNRLVPIKGHLVLLKPQLNLQYLYSSDHTYVFPREDHVVVGGSTENGVSDPTVDPAICKQILQLAKDVFAGETILPFAPEPWMLPLLGDGYR
jgi:D-amino-acid oxidase